MSSSSRCLTPPCEDEGQGDSGKIKKDVIKPTADIATGMAAEVTKKMGASRPRLDEDERLATTTTSSSNNNYCECGASVTTTTSPSISEPDAPLPLGVSSHRATLTDLISPEHLVLGFHAFVFLLVVMLIVRALLLEYKRAYAAWMTSGSESEVGGVFTAAPRTGAEDDDDEPSSSALQLGSPVVHPLFGRGDVVSFDMRGGVVVHYDASDEKRLHAIEEKPDLLQIGMKVNHPQRGPGR